MNLRCPYCWEPLLNEQSACCGERGHAEPDPDAEAQEQQEAAEAAKEQ